VQPTVHWSFTSLLPASPSPGADADADADVTTEAAYGGSRASKYRQTQHKIPYRFVALHAEVQL
jgi:hypothetical protein